MNILIDSFTKNLFRFKGRATRKEYFLFICAWISILLLGGWLINYANDYPYLLIPAIFCIAIGFLCIFQDFAITARRLHDLNFSGWWQIAILLIPFGQLVFIALFFIKGTKGPNNYGPPDDGS